MASYIKCSDCGALRKRYMLLGDKKICGDCYKEYAGEAFINDQREINA